MILVFFYKLTFIKFCLVECIEVTLVQHNITLLSVFKKMAIYGIHTQIFNIHSYSVFIHIYIYNNLVFF